MRKKRINKGAIINGIYTKYVSFTRAVLWKDRQLSLRRNILLTLKFNDINNLSFVDLKKKEKWNFELESILKNGQMKQVGQEEQFYFPIDLAVKESINDPTKSFLNFE